MERITDIAAQNWYGDVANSSKLSTYVLFKTVQCKEEYLGYINNKAFRTALTRFRVSAHDLLIEREDGMQVYLERIDFVDAVV
jgi:hypothetical protein